MIIESYVPCEIGSIVALHLYDYGGTPPTPAMILRVATFEEYVADVCAELGLDQVPETYKVQRNGTFHYEVSVD